MAALRDSSSRVAIVYDRVNKFGGAERVLQFLHKLYPDASLYTSVFDDAYAPWTKGWRVIPSFLQKISFLRKRHEMLAMFMPIAFESFDFSTYDLVISVTSEAAKGIITKPSTQHVCWVLTPTRYLWEKEKEYERDYFQGMVQLALPFFRGIKRYLKWWDVIAAHRPDKIIAISHVVAERFHQTYHKKVDAVIYPPIQFQMFETPQHMTPHFEKYYLCVSRLVPYKRIDIAIRAAQKLNRNVVIIGTGSELERLKRIAGNTPSIYFAGHLTDAEVVGYYQRCTGFLFPGEEDFGLTALEAMAAGRPPIVQRRSGNAEVVTIETGIICKALSVDALVEAMQALEAKQWDKKVLQSHAKTFDETACIKQWRKLI